jgi:hypothetical protein
VDFAIAAPFGPVTKTLMARVESAATVSRNPLSPGSINSGLSRRNPSRLDATTYPALAARSRANPITYYSTVEPNLFDSIIDKYRHSGHAHSAPVRR